MTTVFKGQTFEYLTTRSFQAEVSLEELEAIYAEAEKFLGCYKFYENIPYADFREFTKFLSCCVHPRGGMNFVHDAGVHSIDRALTAHGTSQRATSLRRRMIQLWVYVYLKALGADDIPSENIKRWILSDAKFGMCLLREL